MERGPKYERLNREDAALLLLDHQAGLMSLVRDIGPAALRANVCALAEVGRFFKLPSVLTTSLEDGPNGPLLPELQSFLPDATYIPRPGEINAWDNPDFVSAVKATGRRQLILAGIVTDVCVAFVALAAIEAGYEVFVVTDASGTFNELSRHSAWLRMLDAGAQLVPWFSVVCELQRDWRGDAQGLTNLLSSYIPEYRDLVTTYTVRQAVRELEPA